MCRFISADWCPNWGCVVSQLGRCDGGLFHDHDPKWAVLVFTLGRIAFWVGVAGVLHYNKWYWAL